MSQKQERILSFITMHSPKKIGVRHAFYRIEKGRIELKFVVDEENASVVANYLNALSKIIKETENIDIVSNVYIYKPIETKKIMKDLDLIELPLIDNFSFSSAC